MIKNKKILFFCIIVLSFLLLGRFLYTQKDEIYINSILLKSDYSYLPKEAKKYIKNNFYKTGNILLTEKNKKDNKIYLNPSYVEYLTMTKEEQKNMGDIPTPTTVDYPSTRTIQSASLPSSYDLRNVNGKNYITPVRNQGNLGICWTFATAGAAESHLLLKNNTTYNSSSTLISERQIDYLTSNNGIKDYDSEYQNFVTRSLGQGGNFYISTYAISNGVSLFNYNKFKSYNDTDLNQMSLSDVISYNKSQYEVNETINVPRNSYRESTGSLTTNQKEQRQNYINEIKQNIMENGAGYVGTYMNNSCLIGLSNGNLAIDMYKCDQKDGHAMEVIGWNDNLQVSYCKRDSSGNCTENITLKGFWILKNSWGNSYQYPYLAYDSLYSDFSFIKNMNNNTQKNWENNYIVGEDSFVSSKNISLENSKIKGKEKLKKIKLLAMESKKQYKVKIINEQDTYTYTYSNDLPGMGTINISNNIEISKSTNIEISGVDGANLIGLINIFTDNIDKTEYVDVETYNNKKVTNILKAYSETKNIPSGTKLGYKLYNSNNIDKTSYMTVENNEVAENNVNTKLTFSNKLYSDDYRIDIIYNKKVVSSFNIIIDTITGSGTESDPYIIKDPSHLARMSNNPNSYYELSNDIDLSKVTSINGDFSVQSEKCSEGFGWKSINNFKGHLDGKGYKIKGLKQNNYLICNVNNNEEKEWSNEGNGLFSKLSGNVTIKNLILEDFDINCQGGNCGLLVSNYDAQNNIVNDETEYNANFENIIVKDCKINGIYNPDNLIDSLKYTNGAGLFGEMKSPYGTININSIYLDLNTKQDETNNKVAFLYKLNAKTANIRNIQLKGTLEGTKENNKVNIFNNEITSNNLSIKNILSTMVATNAESNLLGTINSSNLEMNGINAIKNNDNNICKNITDCTSKTNIKLFEKNTEINEFMKEENYLSWENFSTYWEIKTIDGIKRLPILKNTNIQNTSIEDINVTHKLNEKANIYDYIEPNIETAKQIVFKSNNEDIVKIDKKGNIIPQKNGNTTIHIESLYDGYIKDVPISTTYIPYYTINFDANGGEGKMDSIEVSTDKNYTLPTNKYTKNKFAFIKWNTKEDGSGESYNNQEILKALEDKEEITLYAIWIGEEQTIYFDANGGEVDISSKVINYADEYGDLPIPKKEGYAFKGWYIDDKKIDSNCKYQGNNLKAKWEENSYNIIYNSNDGKINKNYEKDDSTSIISKKQAVTFVKKDDNKELLDYIFNYYAHRIKEWNTKEDGTGESYNIKQTINIDSDLILYAIWEEDYSSILKDYNYDKTNNYIINIPINTNESNFIENIIKDEEYLIKVDYKTINNKKLLYTGSKTKIYYNDILVKEITNVVSGDTDGSGTIDYMDYVKVYNHIQKVKHPESTKKLLKNEFLKAGDMLDDGTIDYMDYVKIYNKIRQLKGGGK